MTKNLSQEDLQKEFEDLYKYEKGDMSPKRYTTTGESIMAFIIILLASFTVSVAVWAIGVIALNVAFGGGI